MLTNFHLRATARVIVSSIDKKKAYSSTLEKFCCMFQLIESCSQIAGACLEQTTWLRRNLAVREDVLDVSEGSTEGKEGKIGAGA